MWHNKIYRPRETFELRSSGPEILHLGYQGNIGNGDELPAITLGDDVSIEVLVSPESSQALYADIISNHLGVDRGFCIEQVGTEINHYEVSFGTEKGWTEVGSFLLSSGHRHYISLQLKSGEATLYVDGNVIGSKILPAARIESSLPVWIGNWDQTDRPFNGWIQEVLIAKHAKTEQMVISQAKRLLERR